MPQGESKKFIPRNEQRDINARAHFVAELEEIDGERAAAREAMGNEQAEKPPNPEWNETGPTLREQLRSQGWWVSGDDFLSDIDEGTYHGGEQGDIITFISVTDIGGKELLLNKLSKQIEETPDVHAVNGYAAPVAAYRLGKAFADGSRRREVIPVMMGNIHVPEERQVPIIFSEAGEDELDDTVIEPTRETDEPGDKATKKKNASLGGTMNARPKNKPQRLNETVNLGPRTNTQKPPILAAQEDPPDHIQNKFPDQLPIRALTPPDGERKTKPLQVAPGRITSRPREFPLEMPIPKLNPPGPANTTLVPAPELPLTAMTEHAQPAAKQEVSAQGFTASLREERDTETSAAPDTSEEALPESLKKVAS